MDYRGHESTPDLETLEQIEDDYSKIRVPVKVTEVCEPVQVHQLPAREAIMRSFIIGAGATVQILGRDLRRSAAKVWAHTEDASVTSAYIGTNLGEVEQGTAALLPVLLNDFTLGMPFVLSFNHIKEMWVRNVHDAAIVVSVVSEYWAD